MKTNKIEIKITYFIICMAIFLLNINSLSILSLVTGSILGLLFILLFEKTNLKRFKFINFLIFLVSFILMISYLNKTTYFISNNILREYSTLTISFTLLGSIFILTNKGYHTIIKIIILFTYFSFFTTILGFLFLIPYVKVTNLETNLFLSNNLFLESLRYAFLIFYTYLLIYPISKTKFSKNDLLINSSSHIFIYLLIISVLGKVLTNLYKYPYITIFKKVNLIGFVERIEIIYAMNTLFLFYFLLTLIFYQINTFVRQKKDKQSLIYLLIVTILIFITSFSIL